MTGLARLLSGASVGTRHGEGRSRTDDCRGKGIIRHGNSAHASGDRKIPRRTTLTIHCNAIDSSCYHLKDNLTIRHSGCPVVVRSHRRQSTHRTARIDRQHRIEGRSSRSNRRTPRTRRRPAVPHRFGRSLSCMRRLSAFRCPVYIAARARPRTTRHCRRRGKIVIRRADDRGINRCGQSFGQIQPTRPNLPRQRRHRIRAAQQPLNQTCVGISRILRRQEGHDPRDMRRSHRGPTVDRISGIRGRDRRVDTIPRGGDIDTCAPIVGKRSQPIGPRGRGH